MLDSKTLFLANDQIALITAITMTDVTAKKLELYSGMARDNEVKDFFASRVELLTNVNKRLRKELDRVGGR